MFGFLPPIEPSESFDGYQGRVAAMTGKREGYTWCSPENAGAANKAIEFFRYAGCGVIMTPADAIDRHTIYPYHAAFIPADSAEKFRKSALLGRRAAIYGPSPRRFCSECVIEDVARLGFAVWKTQHYLPFTQICSIHQSNLLTPVPLFQARDLTHFDKPSASRRIENRQLFLKIAELGQWLLAHRPQPVGRRVLWRRMDILLADAGLLTDIRHLGRILIQRYGKHDLELLRCIAGDTINRHSFESYLLLLAFMGLSPTSLFFPEPKVSKYPIS
jgi:hypothetical protein